MSSLKDTIQGLVDTLLKIDNGNNETSAQDVSDSVALVLDNLTNLGANYYGTVVTTSAAISEPAEGATVLPLEDGTYTNYNGLIRDADICVFVYESATWVKKVINTVDQLMRSLSFEITTNITYNNDGIFEFSDIKWSNGDVGTITYGDYNSSELAYDSFVATNLTIGKTITQNAVTRDNTGNIIIKPELILS